MTNINDERKQDSAQTENESTTPIGCLTATARCIDGCGEIFAGDFEKCLGAAQVHERRHNGHRVRVPSCKGKHLEGAQDAGYVSHTEAT